MGTDLSLLYGVAQFSVVGCTSEPACKYRKICVCDTNRGISAIVQFTYWEDEISTNAEVKRSEEDSCSPIQLPVSCPVSGTWCLSMWFMWFRETVDLKKWHYVCPRHFLTGKIEAYRWQLLTPPELFVNSSLQTPLLLTYSHRSSVTFVTSNF